MQTGNKPAIQGGFDLKHASGFYIGNWNSSISWLSDADPDVSSSVEMDFYAGYTRPIWGDLSMDVGVLHYYYPGSYPVGFTNPDTTEGSLGDRKSAMMGTRGSVGVDLGGRPSMRQK